MMSWARARQTAEETNASFDLKKLSARSEKSCQHGAQITANILFPLRLKDLSTHTVILPRAFTRPNMAERSLFDITLPDEATQGLCVMG